jgi:1-acyl-sn-glycerol-3-phosphate acyltransferase
MAHVSDPIIDGERFPLAVAVRATLARLILLLFRVRIVGEENVPAGGAVLAGNHVSNMDPVLLWCASPRPCRFMSKAEAWRGGATAWGLPRLWSFPVERGEADRTAIARATRFVAAGQLVGIFPEGTRAAADGTRAEAQGGAAFIALRAGVPIVPVAFMGTEKVLPRGRTLPRLYPVTIAYGEPIDAAGFMPDAGRKERVEMLTAQTMRGIDALLEDERGAGR